MFGSKVMLWKNRSVFGLRNKLARVDGSRPAREHLQRSKAEDGRKAAETVDPRVRDGNRVFCGPSQSLGSGIPIFP